MAFIWSPITSFMGRNPSPGKWFRGILRHARIQTTLDLNTQMTGMKSRQPKALI